MRYHHKKKKIYLTNYGVTHKCDHPVYNSCTLYLDGDKGLAVIQQRYDETSKTTWWGEIDPALIDEIYLNPNFSEYFECNSRPGENGIFPTVTIRQIMWALRMKPMKREQWETVFDRRLV